MTRALIIGGTRGLGRALATHYLSRGMQVMVAGRHPEVLRDTAIGAHPNLHAVTLDIADAGAVRAAVIQAAGAERALDFLVVTAGLYFNSRTHPIDAPTALRMLRTNVTGLAHALDAGAEQMLAQGHGRMAAVASMAGLLKDYPGASTYAASKRAVLGLCATYRKALAPFGVSVTALVPGYVDTEQLRALNGGDARHKPFLMPEAEAVSRMAAAIDAGKDVCAFPWQMRAIIALLNLLPRVPRLPDFAPPMPRTPPADR